MKKILLFVLLSLLSAHSFSNDSKGDLNMFMEQVPGSYTSSEQAISDSNFMDLHLKVKEIWKTNDSSRWLFLQTSFSYDTLYPFKNQLFHLYPIALKLVVIDVYEITDKESLLKTVDSNLSFDTTFLSYIKKKSNCELYLNKVNEAFAAYSKSDRCPDSNRGASYSNRDIEFEGNEFYIWERGYNADAEQVWGPLNRGYLFKRILNKKEK